jgi:hypothetical protein
MGDLPLIKLQVRRPARLNNPPRYVTIQSSEYLSILQNKVIPMTKEQIESTYEFIVALKLLRKQFPFIKKIELTDDWSDYQSLYFIDTIIDVDKLSSMYNIKDNKSKYYTVGDAAYLSSLLRAYDNDSKEVLSNIEDKVKDILDKLHKSGALTPEMRLDRKISPSGWIRQTDTAK